MEWKDLEEEVSFYMTIKCTEIMLESGTRLKFYCFYYGWSETFRFLFYKILLILFSLIHVFNIWSGNCWKIREGHKLLYGGQRDFFKKMFYVICKSWKLKMILEFPKEVHTY